MASNATVLKRVAHVVKGVETLKTVVFVAYTVGMIYKHVHALLELLTFGIVFTIVGVQLMIQHVKKVGMHLKIHYMKKVYNAPIAVLIAKS
jgi:hypothetical protein